MAKWLLLLMLMPLLAFGSIDAYEFPDKEMQLRYEQLIAELRCPNCLNTNLAGSDAMIAQDLRREVHRMLIDGKTDQEILDFMQARYGDFILYEPKLSPRTLLLWFGPLLLLVITGIVFLQVVKNRIEAPKALSEEEQARLDSLLRERAES